MQNTATVRKGLKGRILKWKAAASPKIHKSPQASVAILAQGNCQTPAPSFEGVGVRWELRVILLHNFASPTFARRVRGLETEGCFVLSVQFTMSPGA